MSCGPLECILYIMKKILLYLFFLKWATFKIKRATFGPRAWGWTALPYRQFARCPNNLKKKCIYLRQGRPTPCPRAKSGPFDFESGPLEKKKGGVHLYLLYRKHIQVARITFCFYKSGPQTKQLGWPCTIATILSYSFTTGCIRVYCVG